mgnify:CR=1 FL=1
MIFVNKINTKILKLKLSQFKILKKLFKVIKAIDNRDFISINFVDMICTENCGRLLESLIRCWIFDSIVEDSVGNAFKINFSISLSANWLLMFDCFVELRNVRKIFVWPPPWIDEFCGGCSSFGRSLFPSALLLMIVEVLFLRLLDALTLSNEFILRAEFRFPCWVVVVVSTDGSCER